MKMVSTNHLDFHVFEVTWLGFFSDQLETETKIDFPAQLLRQFRINHWNSSCSTIETVAAQPLGHQLRRESLTWLIFVTLKAVRENVSVRD